MEFNTDKKILSEAALKITKVKPTLNDFVIGTITMYWFFGPLFCKKTHKNSRVILI